MRYKGLGVITAKLVAAGMLFGALRRRQYGYYTLLRWVVCGASAYAAFRTAELSKTGWVWVLAVVALFFNPFNARFNPTVTENRLHPVTYLEVLHRPDDPSAGH